MNSVDDDDIVIRKGIPTISFSSAPSARAVQDLQPPPLPADAGQWRFSQCFGDKSEETEVSDGTERLSRLLTNAY